MLFIDTSTAFTDPKPDNDTAATFVSVYALATISSYKIDELINA